MFPNKKKSRAPLAVMPEPAPPPPTPDKGPAGPALAPAAPIDSVLGSQSRFRGEVIGAGPFRVLGHLEGSVRIQGRFQVEPEGRVDADIETDHVVLRGRATGEMRAVGSVRLERRGHFQGDIAAGRIEVEPGAVVNGKVEVIRSG